jgi:hypothetical protein
VRQQPIERRPVAETPCREQRRDVGRRAHRIVSSPSGWTRKG